MGPAELELWAAAVGHNSLRAEPEPGQRRSHAGQHLSLLPAPALSVPTL